MRQPTLYGVVEPFTGVDPRVIATLQNAPASTGVRSTTWELVAEPDSPANHGPSSG